MKKLLLIPTLAIFIISCGNKSIDKQGNQVLSQEEKAKKEADSINKALDQELSDLANDVITDEIDYTITDCSNWIETKNDEVTGTTKIRAKEMIVFNKTLVSGKRYKIGENNVELNIRIDKKDIVLSFHVVGSEVCADEKDKVNILFTDGSRMELTNQAEYNCDAVIAVWLPKKSTKIKELMSKTIKTIRPTINNTYFDVECIENSSIHLNNVLKCLTELK